MTEVTQYDVYTDVDGVEDLIGCYESLDEIKDGIEQFDNRMGGVIANREGFKNAKNIGSLEGFANVRIDVRSAVE